MCIAGPKLTGSFGTSSATLAGLSKSLRSLGTPNISTAPSAFLQTWTRGAPPLLSWPLPGLGMIDSFRLWGSRRCRRIGVHFTSVGLAT